MILRFLFFVWTFCKALSLLAEVSHDEAKMPRRERPLLAGNKALSNEKYRHYINIFIYLFIIAVIIIIIIIIIILVIKQIGQPRPVTITYYYYHVDITFVEIKV